MCVCLYQAQRDIIFELRRIAFDVECEPNNSGSIEKRKSMYTRDYKKLGFIVSGPVNYQSGCIKSKSLIASGV